MKNIYQLCIYVFAWIIKHETSSMPAEVYDDICGDSRNEVSKELRKWPQCYMASNRLHTIKVDDAKYLILIYKNKINNV